MIYVPYALALLVQVVLLWRLVPSAVHRYPLLVLYCAFQFLTHLGMGLAAYGPGVTSPLYRNLYWTTDLTLNLLRFALVIALTLHTIEDVNVRPGIQRLLGIVMFASVVLPLILFHPLWTSRWFRHTSQLMNLGGAVMNLILWTVLLGRRKRDPQLLFVCAGLGISVTGVAIAYGLLQFSGAHLRWLPDLIKSTTFFIGMLVWLRAFRPAKKQTLSILETEQVSGELLERVAL